MGHACIMGKNTWESIPKKFRPLSGRYNIIITRSHNSFDFPRDVDIEASKLPLGICACVDVERAISHGKQYSPGGEVFITGGAQVYNYCLEHNLVDRVLASEIKGHLDIEAGVHFPDLKKLGWSGTFVKDFDQFTVIEYTK